jgi:hypothetical protein
MADTGAAAPAKGGKKGGKGKKAAAAAAPEEPLPPFKPGRMTHYDRQVCSTAVLRGAPRTVPIHRNRLPSLIPTDPHRLPLTLTGPNLLQVVDYVRTATAKNIWYYR